MRYFTNLMPSDKHLKSFQFLALDLKKKKWNQRCKKNKILGSNTRFNVKTNSPSLLQLTYIVDINTNHATYSSNACIAASPRPAGFAGWARTRDGVGTVWSEE